MAGLNVGNLLDELECLKWRIEKWMHVLEESLDFPEENEVHDDITSRKDLVYGAFHTAEALKKNITAQITAFEEAFQATDIREVLRPTRTVEEVDKVLACVERVKERQGQLQQLMALQMSDLKELKRLKNESWNNRMYDYLKALEDYEAGVANPHKL